MSVRGPSPSPLQVCHEATKIDWRRVEQRAQELGILVARVPVRDFGKLDQVPSHTSHDGSPPPSSPSERLRKAKTDQQQRPRAIPDAAVHEPSGNDGCPWLCLCVLFPCMADGRQTQVNGNSTLEGGDWVWGDCTSAEEEVINDTLTRQVRQRALSLPPSLRPSLPPLPSPFPPSLPPFPCSHTSRELQQRCNALRGCCCRC